MEAASYCKTTSEKVMCSTVKGSYLVVPVISHVDVPCLDPSIHEWAAKPPCSISGSLVFIFNYNNFMKRRNIPSSPPWLLSTESYCSFLKYTHSYTSKLLHRAWWEATTQSLIIKSNLEFKGFPKRSKWTHFKPTQYKGQPGAHAWSPQTPSGLLLTLPYPAHRADLFRGWRATSLHRSAWFQLLEPDPSVALPELSEDPGLCPKLETKILNRRYPEASQEKSSHEGSRAERTDKLYRRKMESTVWTPFKDSFTNRKAVGPQAETGAHPAQGQALPPGRTSVAMRNGLRSPLNNSGSKRGLLPWSSDFYKLTIQASG